MILTTVPGEPMGRALGRLVRALLARAADTLNHEGEPASERIHEMRTSIKKVRAVMGLARQLARPPARRRLRRAERRLRDLAARTAAVRDGEVMVKALDEVMASRPGEVKRETVKRVRRELLERLRRAEQDFHAADAAAGGPRLNEEPLSPFRTLADLLIQERRRARDWAPARPRKWSKAAERVTDGMAQTYRRARRSMKRAYAAQNALPSERRAEQAEAAPSPEQRWQQTGAAFHQWRKAVKAHRYQLQLLAGTWPASVTARLPDLEHLGDLLGEEHDLTVLRQTLEDCPSCFENAGERDRVVAALVARQRQLREEAEPLGERLFRQRTRRFRGQVQQRMRPPQTAWSSSSGASVADAARAGDHAAEMTDNGAALGKLTVVGERRS